MGCDIHIYAEVFRDGAWHRSDAQVPNDRSYTTFAKLAGVRNRDELLTPISEPRGIPDDSPTYAAQLAAEDDETTYSLETPWLGDHSFSWLTLAELLAVDLHEPVRDGGTLREWSMLPEIIAALQPLGDPAHVRIVFGFDN